MVTERHRTGVITISNDLVVALIEKESGYKFDKVGDDGHSIGYMQIYEEYFANMEVDKDIVAQIGDAEVKNQPHKGGNK